MGAPTHTLSALKTLPETFFGNEIEMTTDKEMLPCPWCGQPLTEANVVQGSTFRWRSVEGCCTEGPEVRHDTMATDQAAAEADSRARAIEAWNTRATLEKPHPSDTPSPDDVDRWAREAGGIPCGDGTFIAGTVSHTEVARLAYAAGRAAYRAELEGQEPNKREGGEGWESLAWELCADEHGEAACNELIWEGGPIPEPWGDRWMKYEDEAKRLIALVHKHAAPQPGDKA
jgi:hypothetical protein